MNLIHLPTLLTVRLLISNPKIIFNRTNSRFITESHSLTHTPENLTRRFNIIIIREYSLALSKIGIISDTHYYHNQSPPHAATPISTNVQNPLSLQASIPAIQHNTHTLTYYNTSPTLPPSRTHTF